MKFPITLSAPPSTTVKVSWTTMDGTATAGKDYVAKTGTTYFYKGETYHTAQVTVLSDAYKENTESFSVKITDVANASLGSIIDNLELYRLNLPDRWWELLNQ